VLSHPLLVLAAWAVVVELGYRLRPRIVSDGLTRPVLRATLARVFSLLLVLLYVFIVSYYVALPAYVDHVEPSVAAVSWAVRQGQDAYPDPGGPFMYGLPYGPMLFVANGVAMSLAGPSLASSKLAGGVAALGSLALAWVAVRRARAANPLAVIALLVLLYSTFGAAAFWARAEPLLALCAAAAVLSLTLPRFAAVAVAGVALGVAVSLKISAAAYFAPALVVLAIRHRLPAIAGIAALAGLVAASPFLASDRYSLSAYVYWFRSAMGDGVRLDALPSAVDWAFFVIVPLFMTTESGAVNDDRAEASIFRWLLVGAVFLSLPLAIKHGTGHYHFLPFVPSLVFAGRFQSWRFIRPAPLAAACLTVAIVPLPSWLPSLLSVPGARIVEELTVLQRANPGTVGIGYSANYRLSYFRSVPVFAGSPYAIDGASAMDWAWRGRPFPRAVTDAMRRCAMRTWLVPAGSPPFQLPSAYPSGGDVFPDDVTRAFEESYVRAARGEWFDVWRCRQP
jgi:hypothetical protein